LERKLPAAEKNHYPRCIGGSGGPVPEDCGGTIAYDSFRDLFTADYIVHRLAEMLDEGWKPAHVAELQQLRPWIGRGLVRQPINRRLRHEIVSAGEGPRS
jgi:hypothetical protein